MVQLYPFIEPYLSGLLQVSDLHSIYWECSGNPEGLPILVLHGGPGGGSDPLYRRYFNPRKFKIIQFDQRGCGRSIPFDELQQNTTQDLVADIEILRSSLGIKNWHIFGGSWGSTLGLIYSIHYPISVLSLILRGIFLCRDSELQWFYQYGASEIFPEAYQEYSSFIPYNERSDLIKAFYTRLISENHLTRSEASKAWTLWEMSTSRLIPSKEYIEKAGDDKFSSAFARIECHYFINNIFLEDNYILQNINSIKDIPTFIVQGRYDVVCPVRSAWELHTSLNSSVLDVISNAGHSIEEDGIIDALVGYTDRL